MDASETLGVKGGAMRFTATASKVKAYAAVAEAVQVIAERQRLSIPPHSPSRLAREPVRVAFLEAYG